MLDVGAAGVGVVALQRVDHIAETKAHGLQADRVHGHLELLELTTEAVDLGHAGHTEQLATDHPVLQLAQLHRIEGLVMRAVGPHHILEHLTQAGAHGCEEGWIDTRRHRTGHLLQALVHQLAREVGVHVIIEHGGNLAEAEARDAAQFDHAGQTGQRLLHGVAHEALHLERGEGGCEGDDLHLVVGDVGHGIHGQVAEGH